MTYMDAFSPHEPLKKFVIEMHEGYNAFFCNVKRGLNPYFPHDSAVAQAWFKGWDTAALSLKGKR